MTWNISDIVSLVFQNLLVAIIAHRVSVLSCIQHFLDESPHDKLVEDIVFASLSCLPALLDAFATKFQDLE